MIPAVVLLTALAAAIILQRGGMSRRDSTDYLQLFTQVYTLVKARYVEEVDGKKLIDEATGVASAKLFARILADDETRIRDNLVKNGIKFTKMADDGVLQQASEKILNQAIKKASANGADARKILDQIKAAIAKYEAER